MCIWKLACQQLGVPIYESRGMWFSICNVLFLHPLCLTCSFFRSQRKLLQRSHQQNPTQIPTLDFFFLWSVPFLLPSASLIIYSKLWFIYCLSNIHKTWEATCVPHVCLVVEAQYICLEKVLNEWNISQKFCLLGYSGMKSC